MGWMWQWEWEWAGVTLSHATILRAITFKARAVKAPTATPSPHYPPPTASHTCLNLTFSYAANKSNNLTNARHKSQADTGFE